VARTGEVELGVDGPEIEVRFDPVIEPADVAAELERYFDMAAEAMRNRS